MSWDIGASGGGSGWDGNLAGKFQELDPASNDFGFSSGGDGGFVGGDGGSKPRGCFNCGQEG
jgi:hypothetical protein